MIQLSILTKYQVTKYSIILIGILSIFQLSSCKKEELLRNAVISHNQAYWDIHYIPKTIDITEKTNVTYYWFEAGKIHLNQGGFSEYLLTGECKVYSENNRMIRKGNFKNGLKHGVWQTWDENGILLESVNYKNGLKHGEALDFYKDGKLKLRRNYKEGQLDGKTEEYYENLALKETRTYKHNLLSGKRVFYNEQNNITKIEDYRNGELNGEQTVSLEDTVITHHYKDGELIIPEQKKDTKTVKSDTTSNNGIFKKLFSKNKDTHQNKD